MHISHVCPVIKQCGYRMGFVSAQCSLTDKKVTTAQWGTFGVIIHIHTNTILYMKIKDKYSTLITAFSHVSL